MSMLDFLLFYAVFHQRFIMIRLLKDFKILSLGCFVCSFLMDTFSIFWSFEPTIAAFQISWLFNCSDNFSSTYSASKLVNQWELSLIKNGLIWWRKCLAFRFKYFNAWRYANFTMFYLLVWIFCIRLTLFQVRHWLLYSKYLLCVIIWLTVIDCPQIDILLFNMNQVQLQWFLFFSVVLCHSLPFYMICCEVLLFAAGLQSLYGRLQSPTVIYYNNTRIFNSQWYAFNFCHYHGNSEPRWCFLLFQFLVFFSIAYPWKSLKSIDNSCWTQSWRFRSWDWRIYRAFKR